MKSLKLSDFNYDLPKERIAQHPVSPRDSSRLMILNDKIEHKHFYNIIDYLEKGDVIVINETKVIPARIHGKKETGSPVELIIIEDLGKKAVCRIKTRNPVEGTKLIFGKYVGIVTKKDYDIFTVQFNKDIKKIMEDIGELPTPNYIKKRLDKDSQYQTVYSKVKGSIAAPTAGLHFTDRLINKIKKRGVKFAKVCLHVGFGTFLNIRDINQKELHKEWFSIDVKNAKLINSAKRLIVVGTTSVRSLESANEKGKIKSKTGETAIFIKPGYKFKTKIDMLVTNFHLPRSSLLMLVSAFVGRKKILDAYKIAVKEKYRFYSLGDAMLLLKD